MCSRSASITIFSKLACRPPSIQPAPCIMKLQQPETAPHSENIDSYAAWASTALAAHVLELRYGTLYRRANCPPQIAVLKYSGVPNAGAPDCMSTLLVNPP